MKKISLLLIVFLVIGFSLSAETTVVSTSFKMGTEVEEITSVIVGFFDSAKPTSVSHFEAVTEAGTTSTPLFFNPEDPLYHGIAIFTMTNVPGSYSVSTTAMPLVNGNGYILPYSVKIGNANPVKINASSGQGLTLMGNYTASGGLFFERSDDIELSIADADYEVAQVGEYTSTWTINLIKN
ncbi:MAG: hypothetical protein WDA17_00055 [Sphaerochaetaceae bacterium]|nr:hypothetical protein [Candidatus Cloacimonadota bacterium]